MEKEDIIYLGNNLANLTGLPVRLYENKKLVKFSSYTNFPIDPFSLYLEKLGDYQQDITYYIDNYSCYYCFLNFKPYQFVIGPFSHFSIEEQSIKDIAFELGVTKEDLPSFLSAFKGLRSMPLETILQSLCSFNFIFNGRKLELGDVLIQDKIQENYEKEKEEEIVDPNEITKVRNSTLQIEETLSSFVERGDLEAFQLWCKQAPSIRSGQLSNDYLRHFKNTFIVTITLLSRAAIRGGIEYEEAMNITDLYIRKCESLKTLDEITNLQYKMCKDFVERVHQSKAEASPLQNKIANYAYAHISEQISLDELCQNLAMSKSNLCLRFKQENGGSVTNFILDLKIKEGQKLLVNTQKPIASIALYLGFSSQAHFSSCFKKRTGISPIRFRQNKSSL